MRELIKKISTENFIGGMIFRLSKLFYDFYRFKVLPDYIYISKLFEKNLGYKLNLKNPETINEKIQWLKLNDRTKLHTTCADKYAVRGYVKEVVGEDYLIPLVFETEKPEDINYNTIPSVNCIIKTNHSSGSVVIVRDKENINWLEVQKKLRLALKENYYYPGREWQYKNIKPRIIVEKLLLDENNEIPSDYKLHCFNGEVKVVQVDMGRFSNHRRNLYDADWKLLDCDWVYSKGNSLVQPTNFTSMKRIAEKLAEAFIYVRVDLYSVGEKIFFGELTFHTESGWGKFSSFECDRKFGSLLDLSRCN